MKPEGATLYTHTVAGQSYGPLGILEDANRSLRARYRTEIFIRSRQRHDLYQFNNVNEQERKRKFFVWT